MAKKLFPILILLALALAMLLPANPAWMGGAYRDSGVFLYVGWRILQGEMPYVNAWDHKPPAIFYVNAAGLALAGGSRWGVWIIELLALGLAAWLGWRSLRRAFGEGAAFFASALWLLALPSLIEGGNLTTEYTLPVQFACLGLFYAAEERGRSGWRAFAIGALCGLAFLFKPNLIGIGLAIALVWIGDLSGFKKPERSAGVRPGDLLRMAGGAAAMVGGVGAYLWAVGAQPAFWDAAVIYNAAYARQPLFEYIGAVLKGIGYLNESGLFLLAALGWLAALLRLRSLDRETQRAERALLLLALIDLPIELLLVGLTGRGFRHYWLALLPVCALLAAQGFQAVTDYFRRPAFPRQAAWIAAVLILLVAAAAQSTAYYMHWMNNRLPDQAQIVSYITANTAPDDAVLVWGSQPGINFLAQRRSPSRYSYQLPLLLPGYTTAAMVESFLADLQAEPPRLVICAPGNDWSAAVFPVQSAAIEAGLRWLAEHYTRQDEVSGWIIYEPGGAIPSPAAQSPAPSRGWASR